MIRTAKTSGALRELARASHGVDSRSASNVLSSLFKSKGELDSWLQIAADGMHPNFGIHHAAATGNVGLVKYALDNGQPHSSNLNGIFPLHAACSGGDEATVVLLLERGADVNAARQLANDKISATCESEGSTPLHFAAANGHIHLVRLLLEHGAFPALKDCNGLTPEALAVAQQHNSCAALLRTWIATKGPCASLVRKASTTTSDQHSRLQPGSSKSSLQSQRSFENFFTMASSLKESLRSKRKSLYRLKTGMNSLSLGPSNDSCQSDIPPLPISSQEPTCNMTGSTFLSSDRHRSTESKNGSLSRSDQRHLPSSPDGKSDRLDRLGLNSRRERRFSSRKNRNASSNEKGRAAQTTETLPSRGTKESCPSVEASSMSSSFLPSLDSSTESLALESNSLRTNSTAPILTILDTDANRERSASDGALKTFPTAGRSSYGQSHYGLPAQITKDSAEKRRELHRLKASKRSMLEDLRTDTSPSGPQSNFANAMDEDHDNGTEDAQELLEGSTEDGMPFPLRSRTCSTSSNSSRHLSEARQRIMSQTSQARSSRSISPFAELNPPRRDNSVYSAGSLDACSRAGSEKDVLSSRTTKRSMSPLVFNDTSDTTMKRRKASLLRSGSINSSSNASEGSMASAAPARGNLPTSEQAQSMVQSAESELRKLSRSASQDSLKDMLASYGEALALQRKASNSTASNLNLTRDASTTSLQSMPRSSTNLARVPNSIDSLIMPRASRANDASKCSESVRTCQHSSIKSGKLSSATPATYSSDDEFLNVESAHDGRFKQHSHLSRPMKGVPASPTDGFNSDSSGIDNAASSVASVSLQNFSPHVCLSNIHRLDRNAGKNVAAIQPPAPASPISRLSPDKMPMRPHSDASSPIPLTGESDPLSSFNGHGASLGVSSLQSNRSHRFQDINNGSMRVLTSNKSDTSFLRPLACGTAGSLGDSVQPTSPTLSSKSTRKTKVINALHGLKQRLAR